MPLYCGAAYYPELWPASAVEQDIYYMKDAGINVVRMGEFAWSKIEADIDAIDPGFFVDITRKLHDEGISTIIGTPTATPPIWMSHEHSERMYVDEHGTVMSHGARQHVCTNNPFFRERASIIVEALAKSLGDLPGVIAWQIHNELKNEVTECMCDSCKEQWHAWLEARYLTVDNLNDAWGTDVWSQRYQRFDEVPQPVATTFLHSSSLSTAYRTFSREKAAEFVADQAKIIRRFSSVPITHNTNRLFALDNELVCKHLDFASFDNYVDSDSYQEMLVDYSLWRNSKKHRGFWVMETSSSHNGQLHGCHRSHPDGFLVSEAVSAYAMGAEGFCFWVWRQQRAGCEQLHGAIISSWGTPTIGYKEVYKVNNARKKLESIISTSKLVQSELAITYSDRARSFLLTEPMDHQDYVSLMSSWYNMVSGTGIQCELVFEEADLAGYKILMTPFMHYISSKYMRRAVEFVENGGTWIVGPLSGGRTAEHTIHTDFALGELEQLAGVETAYTYPLDGTQAMGRAFGKRAELGFWSAVFRVRDAQVVGVVEGGITPGLAFITERKLGRGRIVLLGSMPLEDSGEIMLASMVNYYAGIASVTARSISTHGTLVVQRERPGAKIWIVVNMNGAGGTVELPAKGIDVLTDEEIDIGSMEVAPYEYRVIEMVSVDQCNSRAKVFTLTATSN